MNHEHIGRWGSKVEIVSQSLPIAPIYASRLTFVLALTNLASYASYLKCGDGRHNDFEYIVLYCNSLKYL